MTTERIPVPEIERLVSDYMVAADTSRPHADAVARALVLAEIDGLGGHGLTRIDSYSAQSRAGKVDGHAEAVFERTRAACLAVDVANGFCYLALERVTQDLPAIAAETGIAAAGLFRSHHAGALGQVAERLADAGCLSLVFANAPQAMTAYGGRRPLFGTNPIAFGAPRRGRAPLIVDLALSEVARGKILAAAQKGEEIPLGWAKDADGNPTTDAKAALKGTVEPAGGAKGAALALMVEILAASLVGANQSFEASSFFDADGPPPGVGQFVIAVDPAAFAGADVYADKLENLAAAIEDDAGARLPGARKQAAREDARDNGLAVATSLIEKLRA